MSFLTPLYLLGALAVGLPVLFHMIRRTPRGRQAFSSVMFLEPSPPRITRRSRIEHWLLLALRALAVCLLAVAFARPFLRTTAGQPLQQDESRDVVILLDQSASMRREGIWAEATQRVEALLDEMQPQDRVSLMAFDTAPHALVDFSQWGSLDVPERLAAAKAEVAELSPTWGATHLGAALIEAAERLESQSADDGVPHARTIVLVSDLQEGSRLEALQSYQWPPQVRVRLETVGIDVSPNNAGLQPFAASGELAAGDARIRVRVANASNARREQFRLDWAEGMASARLPDDDSAEAPGTADESRPVKVIVPPGQSRVIAMPDRPSALATDQLVLAGDDHEFDNRCFVPVPVRRTLNVAIASGRGRDDEQGMWYYVDRALASTPGRTVEIRPLGETPDMSVAVDAPELIILAAAPNPEVFAQAQRYLANGGTVLVVPVHAADVALIYELLGAAPSEATEAAIESYAMLTKIDFTHPLFAALDHPRYSDFTRIRFWKHRRLDPATLPDGRILAEFDDGDVAIGQINVGAGRLVYFTAGWHPDDSQLALSTKFVPMINGLLDRAAGIVERRVHYFVGDAIDLSLFNKPGENIAGVRTPNGDRISLGGGSTTFGQTDQIGRYQLLVEGERKDSDAAFVVNLDPAESQTARLPLQSLKAANVNLDVLSPDSVTSTPDRRQLRGSELENRQKLWRWLIVVLMGVLLAETWLAGRAARRPASPSSAG